MAKNSMSLDFSDFEKLADKLEKLAGDEALSRGIEAGMKAAKADMDKDIKKAMQKSNLPAKGKYSTGKSLEAMIKGCEIEWSGSTASVNAGFDRTISITPIYLMNGCPKYPPVPGLKTALKLTTKHKKSMVEAAQKVVNRVMKKG